MTDRRYLVGIIGDYAALLTVFTLCCTAVNAAGEARGNDVELMLTAAARNGRGLYRRGDALLVLIGYRAVVECDRDGKGVLRGR